MPDETQDLDADLGDFSDAFDDEPEVISPDQQSSEPAPSAPDAAEAASPADAGDQAPEAPAGDAPSAQPAHGADAPDVPDAPAANPFERPQDAAPFQFRVDRTDVTVEGAWITPDGQHIVFPREAWERQVRSQWLGNRSEWSRRERALHDQVRQATEQRSSREQQAEAILTRFDELMKQGPEAVAAWLDDFERSRPLLMAEAAKAAAEAEAQALRAQAQQQADADRRQAMLPQLQNQLGSAVEEFLRDPRFATVAETRDEQVQLLRDLWEHYGARLFWEADRDYPEYGVPRGTILLQRPVLEQFFEREAARVKRYTSRSQKAAAADARNQQRLASPKPAAPAPNGRPATQQPKQQPAPAGAEHGESFEDFRDRIASEDWLADD